MLEFVEILEDALEHPNERKSVDIEGARIYISIDKGKTEG